MEILDVRAALFFADGQIDTCDKDRRHSLRLYEHA